MTQVSRELCPDVEFGAGCDYADVKSTGVAFLYELKTCTLDFKDARKASSQLDRTKDDLAREGIVDSNCGFELFILHEKRKGCSVDARAIAWFQRTGVRLADANSDAARRVTSRLKLLQARARR